MRKRYDSNLQHTPSYQQEGVDPPEAGYYSVILFDNKEAACIIRDTHVSIVPFNQVSERHAYLESEDT